MCPDLPGQFPQEAAYPHRSYGKPDADKQGANLTKAEDVVLQTANANKNFVDKSQAAAKKPRNGGKDENKV